MGRGPDLVLELTPRVPRHCPWIIRDGSLRRPRDGRGCRAMSKKQTEEVGSSQPAKVAATVMLSLGRTEATHQFEEISVSADDPSHVTVLLSSADGRKIAVMLPRAEVKRLISWRMLMSL
jgi:hypothetical protein